MRVIINIDDTIYKRAMVYKDEPFPDDALLGTLLIIAVNNGTSLPKTNGAMIKTMFPDCKDWKAKIEEDDGEVHEIHFVQLPNSVTINKYDEGFWNAPCNDIK